MKGRVAMMGKVKVKLKVMLLLLKMVGMGMGNNDWEDRRMRGC